MILNLKRAILISAFIPLWFGCSMLPQEPGKVDDKFTFQLVELDYSCVYDYSPAAVALRHKLATPGPVSNVFFDELDDVKVYAYTPIRLTQGTPLVYSLLNRKHYSHSHRKYLKLADIAPTYDNTLKLEILKSDLDKVDLKLNINAEYPVSHYIHNGKKIRTDKNKLVVKNTFQVSLGVWYIVGGIELVPGCIIETSRSPKFTGIVTEAYRLLCVRILPPKNWSLFSHYGSTDVSSKAAAVKVPKKTINNRTKL